MKQITQNAVGYCCLHEFQLKRIVIMIKLSITILHNNQLTNSTTGSPEFTNKREFESSQRDEQTKKLDVNQ